MQDKEEYLKCKESFDYFYSNYMFKDKKHSIKFTPYKTQMNFIKSIEENQYVIALKNRQAGASHILQNYLIHSLISNNNFTAKVISVNRQSGVCFTKRIYDLIEALPKWMNAEFTDKNEQSFRLQNGSKYYSYSSTSFKLKDLKYNDILVIDEAGFCKNIENINFSENKKFGSKSVLVSTKGTEQFFDEQYSNAKNGNSIFTPFEFYSE